MSNKSNVGYRLAAFGVGWLLLTLALEMVLHVLARPELPRHLVYASLSIGAVLGWWGFFWALPGRAKDGMESLLAARERLVRLGRRKSDAVAVIAEPVPVPVVEDRYPVTAETPVFLPNTLAKPPTEASD